MFVNLVLLSNRGIFQHESRELQICLPGALQERREESDTRDQRKQVKEKHMLRWTTKKSRTDEEE